MAVMIPDDVEGFCTDGERHFYGFLKAVAKPDSKYLVWYLLSLAKRVSIVASMVLLLCTGIYLGNNYKNEFTVTSDTPLERMW